MAGPTALKPTFLSCAGLEVANFDAVVIGGGIAGASSAVYLSRAGYRVALLEKETIGGQISVTDAIENYAGFLSVSGPDLAENLEKQLRKWSVKIVRDEALSVKGGPMFTVNTYSGDVAGKCDVVATGSSPRRLGVDGESKFLGKGLSFCAFCDGSFFRDKDVAVIGGGDSAVKESAYLSNIASKVYLIHRRDKFRAEKANIDLIERRANVVKVMNSVVVGFLGEGRLEGLAVRDVSKGSEREIKVEGVFEYVGRDPSTAFLDVKKDPNGYVLVDENMMTSVEGLFAAGECTSPKWRQLAVSAGEGAMAAMSAVDYLERRAANVP